MASTDSIALMSLLMAVVAFFVGMLWGAYILWRIAAALLDTAVREHPADVLAYVHDRINEAGGQGR